MFKLLLTNVQLCVPFGSQTPTVHNPFIQFCHRVISPSAEDAGGPEGRHLMGGIAPSPGTCHHDSFFLVHVQRQVGVLVHVTFVLPYTLSGPQVPQLDLREEAQRATKEGPAGTLVNLARKPERVRWSPETSSS